MVALTQAGIDGEINLQLPSGGSITAATLRTVLHDMNAATFQGVPPLAAPTQGSVPNATSPTAASWTSSPTLGAAGVAGGSLTLAGLTSGSVGLAAALSGSSLNVSQATFGTMLTVSGPGALIANQVSILAAISGTVPKVQAVGTDGSVPLGLQGQGTAGVQFLTSSGSISGNVINGLQVGAAPLGGDRGLGTINTAGSIYIGNAPVGAAQRSTGTVSGTVTTTDLTFTIPANASITGVAAYTTTAFLASGSVNLTAGSAAGDTAYIAAQNIKNLGVVVLSLNGSAPQGQGALPAGSPNYFVRLTQTGTPSAVGVALVVVQYLVI